MLIVDGSDCTGKTTLCKELVEKLNFTHRSLRHAYSYSHLGALPARWDFYKHYVERCQPWLVQDRFHLSELAYGIVTRYGTSITRLEDIERYLDELPAMRVVLTAEDSLLDRRYSIERELFPLRQVKAVNALFVELPWKVTVHRVFHETEETPWPTKEWVRELLSQYIEMVSE